MYLLGKTIQNSYKKNNYKIKIKYGVANPAKPIGSTIKGKISSKTFYNYTTRVVNFIHKRNIAPNYVNIPPLGQMQYQSTIHSFIKILSRLKDNKLPSSISLNYKKNSSINNKFPKYVRPNRLSSKELSDKYLNESLESYLKTTKNCRINDDSIKSLAKDITKNSNTTLQKAKAIFKWVRDNITYVFYRNTKSGAINTLSKKAGNCVDQSHLLIALSRALEIPARYVHGKCVFTSGRTIGHVWAQILVKNVWTVADPISKKNKFGIVNNWDSYKLHGKYNELTF